MSRHSQNLCEVCRADAALGFGVRGSLALMRWFCGAHREVGNTHWKQVNGGGNDTLTRAA